MVDHPQAYMSGGKADIPAYHTLVKEYHCKIQPLDEQCEQPQEEPTMKALSVMNRAASILLHQSS